MVFCEHGVFERKFGGLCNGRLLSQHNTVRFWRLRCDACTDAAPHTRTDAFAHTCAESTANSSAEPIANTNSDARPNPFSNACTDAESCSSRLSDAGACSYFAADPPTHSGSYTRPHSFSDTTTNAVSDVRALSSADADSRTIRVLFDIVVFGMPR